MKSETEKERCIRCAAEADCTPGGHYPLGWGAVGVHLRIPEGDTFSRYDQRKLGMWCPDCLETIGVRAPKEPLPVELKLGPGEYQIPLPTADVCVECGGSAVIRLSLTEGSYAVDSGYAHIPPPVGCSLNDEEDL